MAHYTNFIGSLVLASLVAVAGCGTDPNTNNTGGSGGDGGSGGGGGGSESLTLDELAKELLNITCANSVKCNSSETLADCIATSNSPTSDFQPYIDDGTVVYHPEKVAACLDALKGFGFCSFSELSNTNAGQKTVQEKCLPVFEGTVADDGACLEDTQCKSQLCEEIPGCMMMQCCPSKCAASPAPTTPAKIGESCMMADCEDGAYCQSDMMGDPTTCAAQVAAGQPCTDFDQCKSPAFCEMGVCYAPAAHDATCDPNSFFACDRFDDICDPATMKCVTKGLVGADCAMAPCVDYAFCDMATMKCVKALPDGSTCDPMMMDDNCMNDLICLDSGKCGFAPVTPCK